MEYIDTYTCSWMKRGKSLVCLRNSESFDFYFLFSFGWAPFGQEVKFNNIFFPNFHILNFCKNIIISNSFLMYVYCHIRKSQWAHFNSCTGNFYFQILQQELYRNLLLAGVCVFIVTLLLIANFWTSVIVFTCVIFTLVSMFL